MIAILAVALAGHTFKSCSLPKFEWAVYGKYTTARWYGMTAAVTGNYLFAGGLIKSTIDSEQAGFTPISEDYGISGPYSATDWNGTSATTVTIDIKSYPTAGGAVEKAGGTWRAYDVGVAKIDLTTGKPVDMWVYHGEGMDEVSGMAAAGDVLAISGHFVGNLSAEMTDGSTSTIHNSNTAPGDLPDLADQFHPNQKDNTLHTGVDDGFVIKTSATTGKTDWIVRHPASNRDAQVVGVAVDASGNVFGSGYECSLAANATNKVCHGFLAKFAAADGAVVWEKKFDDLGAALWLQYDADDGGALYFTATTTYGGVASKDGKLHVNCGHPSCAVTGRLSAVDGAVHWLRTFDATPRWGVFDSNGDVELAAAADGPYVYAAFDDAGENGAVSLDAGTPYAACKAADGTVTPEHAISKSKTITAADCPAGSTFIARTDEDAVPAAAANTYTLCGKKTVGGACIVKYHKYTGLPVWARDFPPVAALAAMKDGSGIMATGRYSYSSKWPESDRVFDSVMPPGYMRAEGLAWQKFGIYNAKLAAGTGAGAYVLHSGGGQSDRIYSMASDSAGNIYNVGYMHNTVMNWGGSENLQTKIIEIGNPIPEHGTAPMKATEQHLYVAKLATGTESVPSCLATCTATTDTATVTSGHCFIDGTCYADGDTAEAFGLACYVCDSATSQTEWTPGSAVGTTHCFIDEICWAAGKFLFLQPSTKRGKTYSTCQYCDPAADAMAWTVTDGVEVVDDTCVSIAPSPPPHAGTFTDDEGTTHTWGARVPKIVTGTFQALTLMDMGLPASQIHGTYGERGTDGSNINGVFATSGTWGQTNGNHGDHANAEHERDIHFLSDPTAEEKALLSQMIDVSPECSGTNNWCNKFNATILDINGWPDLIIAGPLFASVVNDEVRAMAAQRGIPVIILSDQNTAKTEWKTFIDLAERFEDLAKALGADVEAHTDLDKQKFCAKAAEFREISREASQRGVRALAGYMPYGPADPDTGNIKAFLQPPDRNPALMMLEELGMGIIHLNTAQSSYYEWMGMWGGGPTMPATSTIMSSGATPVPYTPDFFLYEPRGALDFTSDSFAAAWPHPAVVAKQYAYYPITTLHYSWRHATDILDVVGAKLRTAAKLDPAQTNCTNIEVIDSEHHRTTGLAPGQYACWNPVTYDMCQRTNWQSKATLAGWTAPEPAFKKKTCNLDDNHGPLVGAADVHGGFYVEGINGVINSERDLTSGKRADDGTWEVGIDYNHGQMVLCTGMFCSPDDKVTPKPKYVTAHTCAAIRFEYAANSSSTVYELPNQQALDSCDFSNAILRGDEAAGSPHFDVLIDYDHDKTVYFYASRVGCTDGQKVAVNVVEDHESNFAQCEGMGAGSSRIRHCDCNHQLKPSTLIDPCHTAFVYGCLRDMPDDLSCCPDETVTYASGYINATGGSHNTGTCISKSKVESNLEMVPILKGLRTSDPARLSAFDGGPCVRYSFQTGYDSMCGFYKSISMCDVASKPHECQFDPAWLAWTTWVPPDDGTPPAPTPMSFVDDAGVTHTWTKAQPTIIVSAFDAIALMHMGMDSSQILGTFGTRGTSGSNANGYYHDGNLVVHGDHANSPYDPSVWPQNPDANELAMLAQAHDLSDCSNTNYWCSTLNHTILDVNGWPDLIIESPFIGAAYHSEMQAAAKERGIPIIKLTNAYMTEDTPVRGFIETIHRFEELARALGVSDVTAAVAHDKAALCTEMEAFKAVAQVAQSRGVRALAGYLPYGPASPNGNIAGGFMTPDQDPALMMLEELGMPIMHTDATFGSYYEGFWSASDENGISATNLMSSGGRTGGRVKVPYPVDFWLYDARVTLDFMSSSFAAAWPHPAVVAEQHAQWPSNGHLFSYRHATAVLAGVREKLAVAQKLDPLETTCTSVFQSDRDGVYRGLGPGEYACYNPVSYAMCSAASPSAPPPASYAVKMAVTIAGNVADFTAAVLTPIRQKVATEAAVPLDAVEATATAGSVKIDFTVNMQSKAAADTALTAITAKLADKTAASTFLSTPTNPVTVEEIVVPTVLVLVSPSGNENVTHVDNSTCKGDGDDGVAAGGVAGIAAACALVGLVLGAFITAWVLKRGSAVKRHKSFEVDVAERRKEEEKL